MQRAVGGVAAEIKDRRRDVWPRKHRPALDPTFSRQRLQRGGNVRRAEGGA